MQTITQLNLYRNSIGSEGAKALATAFQNNQVIDSSSLSANLSHPSLRILTCRVSHNSISLTTASVMKGRKH